MRNLSLATPIFSVLLSLTLISTATAQEERPAARAPRTARAVDTDRDVPGRADPKTRGTNIRASQVIGMEIKNPAGKSIGEVNDIVIDAESGRIRYAAVSYGGFLGVGDKLFAVPWRAFEFRSDRDSGSSFLVLDIREADLKNAPGFDQDNWPDFADRGFTDRVDAMFRIGNREIDVDVNRRGVDIDVERK